MDERIAPLLGRRSVRRFTDQPVAEADLRALLEAAMAAPSARAADPWRFVTFTDRATREAVVEILPNGAMLADAPLGILAAGDLDAANDRQESYLLQDVSAAIENLLVAAHLLGLGACWLGVHPRPERIAGIRRIFALPERVVPVGAVAVGHPAEAPPPRTRFDQAKVHAGAWPGT